MKIMGTNTKIEWADATWNPTMGCSVEPFHIDHYTDRQVRGR